MHRFIYGWVAIRVALEANQSPSLCLGQSRWRSSNDGCYTPSSTGRSAMKRLCAVLVMLVVWPAWADLQDAYDA